MNQHFPAQLALNPSDDMSASVQSQLFEKRLGLAIEAARLGTWELDLQTQEMVWSDRCKELFGLPPEAHITYEFFLERVHPDDRERTDQAVQKSLDPNGSRHYDIEYRALGAEPGTFRWLRANGQSFFDQKLTPLQFVGTVIDITDSKRNEELLQQRVQEQTHALEQQTSELRAVIAELRRSNESLQQFAHIASHDLQEPLRRIQAFSDILQNQFVDNISDGEADMVKRIQRSAHRMQMLVKDLLTFSQISTQREPQNQVPLNEVLDDVLNDLEIPISEKQADIQVAALPTVLGTSARLRQLFQNLIANALKFIPNGVRPFIQIAYHPAVPADIPPRLTDRQHEKFWMITVTDNGIGFDERYKDRIFNPFQRLHGKNEYGGTGIGLAICQRVADSHGGAIDVDSEPGKGSTFKVFLPVQPV